MKHWLISIVAFFICPKLFSQNCGDYEKLLKDIYASVEKLNNEDKGYTAEYCAYTLYKNNTEAVKENVKLFINKTETRILADNFIILKDTTVQVSIVKTPGTILISDVVASGSLNNNLYFNLMRDSLLAESKITKCRADTLEGKKVVCLSLGLSERLKQKVEITGLKFWIDEDKKQIKKISATILNNPLIEKITIVFLKQEILDQHTAILEKRPLEYVFDGDGKPVTEFRDYKLIDARKKTVINRKNDSL